MFLTHPRAAAVAVVPAALALIAAPATAANETSTLVHARAPIATSIPKTVNAGPGVAKITVRPDSTWRTVSFTLSDTSMPSRCPGDTPARFAGSAQVIANSSGVRIEKIKLTHKTRGATYKPFINWNGGRLMWALPAKRGSSWFYGATKTVSKHDFTTGKSAPLSTWVKWSSGQANHTMIIDGTTGCKPIYIISLRRG